MSDEATTFCLDLEDASWAYLFGFLQADGHLQESTRNRGRVSVELGAQDRWLVEQFAALVPFASSLRTRTRTTNFRQEYTSIVWEVCDRRFREALKAAGLTAGQKSRTVAAPNLPFAEADYWRGVVDADGSLGLTSLGFPFVSLITSSDALAADFLAFVDRVTGSEKTARRNTRDHVFNIAVFKEQAQTLARTLYADAATLALPRKKAKASAMIAWRRPETMRRMSRQRPWNAEQDHFILSHALEESAARLGRTEKSVTMRLWRLTGSVLVPGKSVTD